MKIKFTPLIKWWKRIVLLTRKLPVRMEILLTRQEIVQRILKVYIIKRET